jgi:hypothetical protein
LIDILKRKSETIEQLVINRMQCPVNHLSTAITAPLHTQPSNINLVPLKTSDNEPVQYSGTSLVIDDLDTTPDDFSRRRDRGRKLDRTSSVDLSDEDSLDGQNSNIPGLAVGGHSERVRSRFEDLVRVARLVYDGIVNRILGCCEG